MTEVISIPNGYKFCECSPDCKEIILIKDNRGRPRRFKFGHRPKGERSPMYGRRADKAMHWKGGRKLDKDGYIMILDFLHPNCDPKGYIREHRVIMEKHLGRYLRSEEFIHHKNGIKDDNRLENLQLVTKSEHMRIHTGNDPKTGRFYKKL